MTHVAEMSRDEYDARSDLSPRCSQGRQNCRQTFTRVIKWGRDCPDALQGEMLMGRGCILRM